MAVLTSYWTLDVLLFFFSAVLAAYLYMTRNFKYWIRKGVTEARPVPFFGNLRDCCLFRITPGLHFKSLYEQGTGLPYLGFYIFDKPALLLRDPDLVKAVTVKDFSYFQDRYVSAHESDTIAAGNMFVANNPEWRHLRHSSSSIFTSGKLKAMFPLMSAVGTELAHHLNAIDSHGKSRRTCFASTFQYFGTKTLRYGSVFQVTARILTWRTSAASILRMSSSRAPSD